MTRAYIHTFGCKANQYDSELLRQALEAVGITVVGDPSSANIAIVNSCTVTHVSEAKVRGAVRRLSRMNPELTALLVIGCAAALDNGRISSIRGVTSVIRGTNPNEVLRELGLPPDGDSPILRSFRRGTRAWLKIQDGCDEHCTYCATRFARGASKSRAPEEVVREAEVLSETHSELVLTGVHIGSYGDDLRDTLSLSGLVVYLVRRLPKVRFRLSSLEATQIDEQLMDLMANEPHRVAPHVHAPLQSGSDRILKLMGRSWYTPAQYRERIESLAAHVGNLGLGADIIVGFPGETDDDFAATKSLLAALPFTYLHVFPYSPRPVAASVKMGPLVHPDVVKHRSAELRMLADAKRTAYTAARSGGVADVVLLRRSGGRFAGLTEDYLPVYASVDSAVPNRFDATLIQRDGALWAEPTTD